MINTCSGCYHEIRGGGCRQNLEMECAGGERQMYRPAREKVGFGDIVSAWQWAQDHGHGDDCRIERRGTGWVVLWEGRRKRGT